MTRGMPTIPEKEQLFKCARCHNFERLPDKRGDICLTCSEKEEKGDDK